MGLFRTGLDAQAKAELRTLFGGRVRPLASARSAEGAVVGLTDQLVYRTADGWVQLSWHEIERGGWDRNTQHLSWVGIDGSAAELELVNPGRLPQLFKERVNASVVYTKSMPLAGVGSAVISARRDLAHPDAPLVWRASPGDSTEVEQVAADPSVANELARLRAEYDQR
ncbi:hypothetical protein [Propionicimonas sp.]|uniref:hypothetical protein n=1 Tax=Propionicimonas sp. TaxID=1955623 RepID=UPI0017B91A36|nr:hypothetical protein [Propionicimonas sp.]MBU3976134.1 hypothetical protein [Actinomycetota bacterium]MBA3020946.1 hypothetical protein [Propionicimonas sp.]MBU3985324.1 hypothetical protein [Actinomycetota bacterium]MBU4008314.1 hypothetical protein [Actinomycetota bacterium]MBU4064472.1 hypothetical protein [Actinomycetota bacterium]